MRSREWVGRDGGGGEGSEGRGVNEGGGVGEIIYKRTHIANTSQCNPLAKTSILQLVIIIIIIIIVHTYSHIHTDRQTHTHTHTHTHIRIVRSRYVLYDNLSMFDLCSCKLKYLIYFALL